MGKGFEGDQQPHESTLKGNQDSSLCLFKMMVDNDLVEFRCNYICKFWCAKLGIVFVKRTCASAFSSLINSED